MPESSVSTLKNATPTTNPTRWSAINLKNLRFASLFEPGISLIMVLATLPYLANFVRAMATASLWNDEIFTILHFSSKGFGTVLTDYSAPNNHIFFNLLNSLTPWSDSLDPFRARLWSFIAVGLLLLLVLYEFSRRRQYIAGALLFQLVAVNFGLLDLAFQARGYGILCFCALTICLALLRYLEQSQTRWLVAVSVSTVLGTWTIPTFIFFAGPLMLFLFLVKRTRREFFAGIFTVIAILVVHLFVLTQLIKASQTYSDEWGRDFEKARSVFNSIKAYLLNPNVIIFDTKDWGVFLFFMVLVLIPLFSALRQPDNAAGGAIRLIMAAIVIFFTGCLILETPVLRTTAFITVPLSVCTVLIAAHFIYTTRLRFLRPLITLGIAAFFIINSVQQLRQFSFLPVENYQVTAQYIQKTFPKGTEIWVDNRGDLLQPYLTSGYKFVDKFDRDKFARGEMVAVEAPVQNVTKHFDPLKYTASATRVFIFQRWSDYQQIRVAPAPVANVATVVTNGEDITKILIDRDSTTRWSSKTAQNKLTTPLTLRITLNPGTNYRSMYILTGAEGAPGDLQVTIKPTGGNPERLGEKDIGKHLEMVTLSLGDRALDYIELTVNPSKITKPFAISEIWAYTNKN